MNTAIPPPDNSLKWKDYTLIFSALILIGFLVMWVLWRIWLPIRAIRREKQRLRIKFAPQQEDAMAILRPETLHNQTADHIKLVCVCSCDALPGGRFPVHVVDHALLSPWS